MKTIHAVYENGVFRPKDRIELPDHCEVEFEPRLVGQSPAQAKVLTKVYSLLSRQFDSGEHDVAARHSEHQP
jgi:predicted DNA-binding antitoxin AbrB/MazE fold protein